MVLILLTCILLDVRFITVELCVLNYILIVNLLGLSKVFWMRLINTHFEYKFQIHQASLYSIDFVQWLPWKESDYFFPPIGQNKHRPDSSSQVELLHINTSTVPFCVIWLNCIDVNVKEGRRERNMMRSIAIICVFLSVLLRVISLRLIIYCHICCWP